MRPGHIRVFDGLRVTTEHMEHLQGSLHSALQDIREILGLGRVYYGFEAIAEGERAITVLPGLAFDFEKNRIVSDEPKTLEVSFAQGEDTKYVCIKYDQIEDGQVEGQFTRIWDSCSVLLQPAQPDPKQNVILIAKVVKGGEGKFDIVSLIGPESREATETEGGEPFEGKNPETLEILETSAESLIPTGAESPGEPPKKNEMGAKAAGAPATEEKGVSLPPPGPVPSELLAGRMQVKQGVVRLSREGVESNLGTMLLEPLKKKLSAGNSLRNEELRITLAEGEVGLDFPISTLSCQVIISGTVNRVEDGASAEAPPSEKSRSVPARLTYQSTAHGEATPAGDKISQFGVSMIQISKPSGTGEILGSVSELTECGIAHLPLGTRSRVPEKGNAETFWDTLHPLQLLVRIDKRDGGGFKIICNLWWKGGADEEIIRRIETQKARFTCEVLVAWKALGMGLTRL
jgi:hypothetical protein